ncbi:MAG: hypothetical protein AB7T63_08190 [Planctomycetota bacterium]
MSAALLGLPLPAWGLVALLVVALAIVARAERRLRHRIARLVRRVEEGEEALERIEDALVARRREGREIASGRLLAAVRTARDPRPEGARDVLGRDVFAWRVLGEASAGAYGEAGAGDGEGDAPTALFEALGWRGVLIEADPEKAARARAARPASQVLARALVGPGSPPRVTFHRVEGGRIEPGLGPVDGLAFVAPSATALGPVIAAGARTRAMEVDASTLEQALADARVIGRLDLLLVDFLPGAAAALEGLGDAPLPRLVLVAGAGEEPRDDLDEPDERQLVREVADRLGFTTAGRYADHLVLVAPDASDVLERVRMSIPPTAAAR